MAADSTPNPRRRTGDAQAMTACCRFKVSGEGGAGVCVGRVLVVGDCAGGNFGGDLSSRKKARWWWRGKLCTVLRMDGTEGMVRPGRGNVRKSCSLVAVYESIHPWY